MKTHSKVPLIVLTLSLAMAAWSSCAQTVDEQIQVARSALAADRRATVAEAMQFTEAEGIAFWPMYEKYRAEMDQHGSALLKLVKEYAELYPNVPDERAKVMLKELGELERHRVETKASCLRKIEKVIPPAKTLRFSQVESRLDLALRLAVAASIPLVPVEGSLTGQAAAGAVVVEGVPGGGVVATYELRATVAAIDKASRKVTLVDASGIKKTVKAGPEVINFDQVRVGDQLAITATEELVISMAGSGETLGDGGAGLVALAPKGAKPGGIVAETTRITAKVTALDVEHRKATLQLEDGSSRVVAVRPDVDLSKRKIGDSVVLRITESLAIQVSKP